MKKQPSKAIYVLYILATSALVFLFSLFMLQVVNHRDGISYSNYQDVSYIFQGPVYQDAPMLNLYKSSDAVYDSYIERSYLMSSDVLIPRFSTGIVSTKAVINIRADFVKKGLEIHPSYQTEFESIFVIQNNSDKAEKIEFFFPFPHGTSNSEISNAQLWLGDTIVQNSKASRGGRAGLVWEGEMTQMEKKEFTVKYKTVGLGRFQYHGFENPQGSQDFNLTLNILGTRAYNLNSGLSINERIFGEQAVTLVWEKNDLYSAPTIDVEVGSKINPSEQVSRTYAVMAPIYALFICVIIYLGYKFVRKPKLSELSFLSVLFVLFFPLFHYLSSFGIDPTSESFNFGVSSYVTLPLYAAFTISLLLVGGIMTYYLARSFNMKFSLTLGLPIVLIALGFYPLAATIPEYFVLIALLGILILTVIAIQVSFYKRSEVDEVSK